MMRKFLNQKGFTLIELMFSTAIFGLVVLLSFKLLTTAHQMSQESRYRLIAANSIRSILEEVKDTPLELVTSIDTGVYIPTDLPNGAVQILTNPANLSGAELATVTVRMTWTNPKGLPGVLEITTMRSEF